MADAATLIVLVAAGEAADATTRAMARATREALGPVAHVIVRETAGEPGDADVAAVEHSDNPDAVVELSWIGVRESRHRQASVRMHLRTGRWVDRWITFRPTDADGERGRTVGFAIASILPEESGEHPAPGNNGSSAPSTSPASGATPPVSAVPEGPGTPSEASPGPGPPGPAAPPPPGAPASPPPATPPPAENRPVPESPNPSQEEHAPRLTADLLGIAFWDPPPGTDAIGGGGSVSAQYYFMPILAARAGGSLRGGSIQIGQAKLNFNVWSVFAGLVYAPLRPRMKQRFGVSVRAHWVVEFPNISQSVLPGESNSGSPHWQWNTGPELAADAAVLIVPDVEAVLGVGGQYMLRGAYITVRGEGNQVAWGQPRPFAEGGFRIRF
jgi:hypothetical protein